MSSLTAIKNAEDKSVHLKARMDQQRKLGAHIDTLMRQATDEPNVGCGVCHVWRRLTGRQRTVALAVASEATSSTSIGHSVASLQTQSRLFGVRKADPHLKLAEAATSMESRIAQLESRASSEREEAKRLVANGQKASALRVLKRAKATEKQVEANQQSLMAIEQQVDLMAQAQMQKQLATALASSSKGMKGQKTLLKTAENAVDDASEARDMAEDLSNVMAEFAQKGNDDDDELLAELDAMMSNPPPPDPSAALEGAQAVSDDAVSAASDAAKKAEIATLEARLQRWDDAVAVRDSLPLAPTGGTARKTEEKARLLSAVQVG